MEEMKQDPFDRVRSWSERVGIKAKATVNSQFGKAQEEMIELEVALRSGTQDEKEKELGDVIVCLVNLAEKIGTTAEDCIHKAMAKNETREKGGKMVGDVFVKASDL